MTAFEMERLLSYGIDPETLKSTFVALLEDRVICTGGSTMFLDDDMDTMDTPVMPSPVLARVKAILSPRKYVIPGSHVTFCFLYMPEVTDVAGGQHSWRITMVE